jgi:hypothetical protein
VPAQHIEHGFALGSWVSHRRQEFCRGKLDGRKAKILERLPGWTWDVPSAAFERAYARLVQFVHREGHARVPQRHVEAGFPLGTWVARIRLAHRGRSRRLSLRQAHRLESLAGWTWGKSRTADPRRVSDSVTPDEAQGRGRSAPRGSRA